MSNINRQLTQILRYVFKSEKKNKSLALIFALFYFTLNIKSNLQKDPSDISGRVSDDVYPLF